MAGTAFVISGLPASGKTTVGHLVAQASGLPFLDKDDFLERLFDSRGTGDRAWRAMLSRQADQQFQAEAARSGGAVLVSHWTPQGQTGTGTPPAWLPDAFETVVEVYCDCPPDIAAARFHARRRHPGHLDGQRDIAQLNDWMTRLAEGYPLGLSRMIRVDTTVRMDEEALRARIRTAPP